MIPLVISRRSILIYSNLRHQASRSLSSTTFKMDGDQSGKSMDTGSASAAHAQGLTEGIHEKANMKDVRLPNTMAVSSCKCADLKSYRLLERRLLAQAQVSLMQREQSAPNLMVKMTSKIYSSLYH
jgi:hypothetical protein